MKIFFVKLIYVATLCVVPPNLDMVKQVLLLLLILLLSLLSLLPVMRLAAPATVSVVVLLVIHNCSSLDAFVVKKVIRWVCKLEGTLIKRLLVKQSRSSF